MNAETSSAMITRRCRVVFRSIALLLGATQLVLARNGFGPRLAILQRNRTRAYLRHDWTMAINAYWSPLYPWLIAFTLQLGKPALRREFPLLHLLNFFIFIVALAGFEFLDHAADR